MFETNHTVFLWTFVLLISQSGFPCVYTKCVFGDYLLCHVCCSRGLFFLFGVKGHHYGGWWLQCICEVVICQSAHACDWCAVWQITTNFWQFPRLFHTAQSSTTESGFVIKIDIIRRHNNTQYLYYSLQSGFILLFIIKVGFYSRQVYS